MNNCLHVMLYVVVASFCACVSVVAEDTTLVEKLRNSDACDRLTAYHELMSFNAQMVSNLLDVVREPIQQGEVWGNPSSSRNFAIKLLGHFRVERAVESIVPFLAPQPGQDAAVLMGRDGQDNVAEEALVRIGVPAVEPLLSALFASDTDDSARVYLAVLRRLLPDEQLKKQIETAPSASASQKKKVFSLLAQRAKGSQRGPKAPIKTDR